MSPKRSAAANKKSNAKPSPPPPSSSNPSSKSSSDPSSKPSKSSPTQKGNQQSAPPPEQSTSHIETQEMKGTKDTTLAATKRPLMAPDETEELRKKIKQLEVDLETERMRNDNFLHPFSNEWDMKSAGDCRRLLDRIRTSFKNWTTEYIQCETKALDSLPEKAKKELVRSLDGFCIQVDLDEIISSLPSNLKHKFTGDLVTLFLFSDCFSRFFTNPYWYMMPDPTIGTHEQIEPSPTHFGQQLYDFHNTFGHTRQRFIQPWRSWTARLCNPAREVNNDFTDQTVARRELIVDGMFKQVLATEFLQPLFAAPKAENWIETREQELKRLYHEAAQLSVDVSTHPECLEFRTLKEIEPNYHHSLEDIEATVRYSLHENKDRLDGHRILAMESPAVYCCDDRDYPRTVQLMMKGRVFIEDKD
ncbi:hypothetical protein BO78DRAFT_438744 [Aspergillus sclerotiicarbonarius CBS 121057]|uniref:Uncharacterized protein n=1 Tax=Aspergillus sclerotiicarbonarius (strain CBS 121057 / IBT 28362) TaxID=1448318 RepID=A0A319F1X6_ASPSB|nr:hypothetical protein BO78DRAFT_438744 [Aspergillus sclerotiicarbonarius CBS 121057]